MKYVFFLLIGILLTGCISNKSEDPLNDQYLNPLGIQGIGDPFILKDSDNTYYCYATSWNNGFLVWKSTDLVNWKKIGPAYSKNRTSWGKSDFWAPEVTFYEGRYFMFYSARWYKNGSLRVGLAVSDNPEGPFLDYTEGPLFDHGTAAIDAHLFINGDGRNYLYYSIDCSENIVDGRHESHIYGVELSEDLKTLIGAPVLLIKPDQEWEYKSGNEWRWNEGPSILKHNNQYYLTYSANFYASREYSVGYAISDSPLGPFEKYSKNPILYAPENDFRISGPGHNSFFTSPDGSEIFTAYHTHTDPNKGGGDRQLAIDSVKFSKRGILIINGPSLEPRNLPRGVTVIYETD